MNRDIEIVVFHTMDKRCPDKALLHIDACLYPFADRRNGLCAFRIDGIFLNPDRRIRALNEERPSLEHRPQHIVLVSQRIPRLLKRVFSGALREPEKPRLVVMMGAGQIHILEKCHDGAVRHRAFKGFLADCVEMRALDALGNPPDSLLLHDVRHRYLQPRFPEKAHQANGPNGISAKFKEAVQRTRSIIHPQYLLHGLSDRAFCFPFGRHVHARLANRGFGKGLPVDFPVGREGHVVKLHEDGGHHVIREAVCEEVPEGGLIHILS